jgi:LacI family transcriptional regulator
LADHGTASVFLDGGGPGPLKANVRIEYRTGVAAAVNYLHHLGHREFALVAGPQGRASHLAYRQAVEASLGGFGLTPAVVEGSNDAASGDPAVQRLLTGRRLPTAVLCSNDLTALSVARAFHERGLRVPADVSVVGADDIPFAALAQPPLTTVRMPRERLGGLAAQLLQRMLAEGLAVGVEEVLDTELVIRKSTGAVRTLPASASRPDPA